MKEIKFSPPDITSAEINEVCEALKSGWITTGPRTKQFENEIASFCHTSKAVCLNSATACMEMSLRVLGIGPGDEVIVPAYTYTATASVVCHVGATLKIVDVEKDTFHFDYEKLENAITDKTKVIMPVDLGGVMFDYDKLFEIVNRKKSLFKASDNKIQKAIGRIIILADGAHSIGAKYKNKMSGEVADFTSFSFHAVKNLTTAEGGAATWRDITGIDNEEIYKQFMLLTLHGQSKDALAKNKPGAWEYDIVAPYYKCNMTDIMAAIGHVQLTRYKDIVNKRHQMIKIYDSFFNKDGFHTLKHFTEDMTSCGHLYLLRVDGITTEQRNEIITELAKRNIATNVHYKPLPLLTAYKNLGFDISDYPNAYNQFHNEITLPLNTVMDIEDISYVAENFLDVLGKIRG